MDKKKLEEALMELKYMLLHGPTDPHNGDLPSAETLKIAIACIENQIIQNEETCVGNGPYELYDRMEHCNGVCDKCEEKLKNYCLGVETKK